MKKEKHWKNCSGSVRFETNNGKRIYKYWHSQKPTQVHISIKNHFDLITALEEISMGKKCQDQYHNVDGLTRKRLIITQCLKDREIKTNINYIARAGYSELQSLVKNK